MWVVPIKLLLPPQRTVFLHSREQKRIASCTSSINSAGPFWQINERKHNRNKRNTTNVRCKPPHRVRSTFCFYYIIALLLWLGCLLLSVFIFSFYSGLAGRIYAYTSFTWIYIRIRIWYDGIHTTLQHNNNNNNHDIVCFAYSVHSDPLPIARLAEFWNIFARPHFLEFEEK